MSGTWKHQERIGEKASSRPNWFVGQSGKIITMPLFSSPHFRLGYDAKSVFFAVK